MEHEPKQNNYAFIDSQNLNLSVNKLGWKLNHERFRKYLAEKYHVSKALLFIGFVEGNDELYEHLEKVGFTLIYKPTLEHKDGSTKGNVDAELVMHAMIEWDNYDKAVIVSGDGDFYCLIDYMIQKDKLSKVVIPNQRQYSALLKRFDSGYLAFVSDLKRTLEYRPYNKTVKRKEPHEDHPSEGA